jgi:hypothetical protein
MYTRQCCPQSFSHHKNWVVPSLKLCLDIDSPDYVSHGFPQPPPPPTTAGIVLQIRLQLLPSTTFPINCSLLTLPLEVT